MKFDKSSDAENDVMSISEENEVNKVDENNGGKENSWEVVYDKLPEEEPTTDKKDTEGNFKPSQVGGGPLQILLLGELCYTGITTREETKVHNHCNV